MFYFNNNYYIKNGNQRKIKPIYLFYPSKKCFYWTKSGSGVYNAVSYFVLEIIAVQTQDVYCVLCIVYTIKDTGETNMNRQ